MKRTRKLALEITLEEPLWELYGKYKKVIHTHTVRRKSSNTKRAKITDDDSATISLLLKAVLLDHATEIEEMHAYALKTKFDRIVAKLGLPVLARIPTETTKVPEPSRTGDARPAQSIGVPNPETTGTVREFVGLEPRSPPPGHASASGSVPGGGT